MADSASIPIPELVIACIHWRAIEGGWEGDSSKAWILGSSSYLVSQKGTWSTPYPPSYTSRCQICYNSSKSWKFRECSHTQYRGVVEEKVVSWDEGEETDCLLHHYVPITVQPLCMCHNCWRRIAMNAHSRKLFIKILFQDNFSNRFSLPKKKPGGAYKQPYRLTRYIHKQSAIRKKIFGPREKCSD